VRAVTRTCDAHVLDARCRVTGGVERLVRQRDVADWKPTLTVWNADDAVLELSRVVADLRPLSVVVDDRRVVDPVGHRHVDVARTHQPRRHHV